jgi:hypothetical protein
VVTTPQLWQSSHTAEHASLAELVLRLRDDSGLSFPQIADELNSLGLLSPRGKPFYSALMHSMYHKWTCAGSGRQEGWSSTRRYVLSQDHYDDLCTVRDTLLLMAQLAGSVTTSRDDYTMLFVRRALIGRLFSDLGFQISDLVDAIAKSKTQMGRAGVQ